MQTDQEKDRLIAEHLGWTVYDGGYCLLTYQETLHDKIKPLPSMLEPEMTVLLLKKLPAAFLAHFTASNEWECAGADWTNTESYVKADAVRDAYIAAFGLRVR